MTQPESLRAEWEQLPAEPVLWYSRFQRYALPLGQEYTHRRAYLLYTDDQPGSDLEAYAVWTTQAIKWNWEARAKMWAEHETFRLQHRWRQRKLELLEEDWGTGKSLRKVASEFLEAIKTHKEMSRVTKEDGSEVITLAVNINPRDLAQLLKTASDLQRLALEEPTAITRTVENKGPGVYLPQVDPVPEPSDSG